jgi:hypothetical protein
VDHTQGAADLPGLSAPIAAVINAVIPLAMKSSVSGAQVQDLRYPRTALRSIFTISSVRQRPPFIDHSSEVWNFRRDRD